MIAYCCEQYIGRIGRRSDGSNHHSEFHYPQSSHGAYSCARFPGAAETSKQGWLVGEGAGADDWQDRPLSGTGSSREGARWEAFTSARGYLLNGNCGGEAQFDCWHPLAEEAHSFSREELGDPVGGETPLLRWNAPSG